MIPGNAKILTCPFCGEKKGVMTVLSYNTFGAIQWSDMKTEMEFDIHVSPVQKCPKCWKYYFKHTQEWEEWKNITFELWTLTYPEATEAIDQLLRDDLYRDSKKLLYITFLHAYNDWFVRNNEDNKHIETKKDIDLFYKIISDWLLVSALMYYIPLDPIFMAELMRETWEFDHCLGFLKNAEKTFKYQPQYLHIVNQIIERAKNKDRKVFIIQ